MMDAVKSVVFDDDGGSGCKIDFAKKLREVGAALSTVEISDGRRIAT